MQLLGAGGRSRTQAYLYQRCDFLHSATHGSRWSLKTNQDYGDSLARDSHSLVPGVFQSLQRQPIESWGSFEDRTPRGNVRKAEAELGGRPVNRDAPLAQLVLPG